MENEVCAGESNIALGGGGGGGEGGPGLYDMCPPRL